MKRKLIKQKSAFTLTLPINWIRENNLDGTEEIEITQENNSLIISTQGKPKTENKHLILSDGDEHYYRILIENQYLKGINQLTLTYINSNAINTIQNIVSNLIGFEILDQNTKSCTIIQTAMPTKDEFKSIIHRLIYLVQFIGEEVLNAINRNSYDNLKKFKRHIADIRRFSLFCRRIIHKQRIISNTNEVFLDLLLERLVIYAYHHYFIYEKLHHLKDSETQINPDIIKHYKKSQLIYDKFRKMFLKNNSKNFDEINKLWNESYNYNIHKLFVNCTSKESVILYHSMSCAFVIFLIAQPNTSELYEEIQKL